MTQPEDRELEAYLGGDSPLSRRYRDASRETAPAELDEVVLARARAEARRQPGPSRMLAPVAVAASLVVALNLGWNLWRAEPLPAPEPESREGPVEPDAPEPRDAGAPQRTTVGPAAAPAAESTARRERDTGAAQAARKAERESRSEAPAPVREPAAPRQPRAAPAPEAVAAAPAMAESAPATPATEPEKIERLIAYVAGLENATFVRNGKEYPAADAAKHLRLKLDKAGDRVRTADDFIRLCASRSYTSGEPYLIRYADGGTRTAEEVLREQLAAMP